MSVDSSSIVDFLSFEVRRNDPHASVVSREVGAIARYCDQEFIGTRLPEASVMDMISSLMVDPGGSESRELFLV